MKIEQTFSTSFGIRPKLKVSKDNKKLFDEVADAFDIYNKKLRCKPDEIRQYEIVQNKRGLTFTEYKDGWEHSVRFGKKLAEEFMEKPADYIAKTFAKAAEVFALDDKLWFKYLKFTNKIMNDKKLSMPNKRQCEYEDCMLSETYNKYILTTLKDQLKENGFLSKAKVKI
jgi:hypothetical protein